MISQRGKLVSAMVGMVAIMSGCSAEVSTSDAEGAAVAENAVAAEFPASLAAFGDGYPAAGDPCRRLGESDATREWLDDSADLVGCPTAEAAAALGGRTVATVEGITIISRPRQGGAAPAGNETGDAMVPDTSFNATAQVRCSMDGSAPTTMCNAGVRRRAGPDGTTFVEVTRPNGMPRVLFFEGTRATGADSAEADGSAAYDFAATRNGDETTISFGPERYVIPDAFVEGG